MITFRVPATIANMGAGFDSFGLAVRLYNTFSFKAAESYDSLDCLSSGQADTSALKKENLENNILFQAMNHLYHAQHKTRPPVQVIAEINIPVARGLGSSSTAIIAGLLAANTFLNHPYSHHEVLKMAIALEGHPDNVTPALLGGFSLGDETHQYQINWPTNWHILIISPTYPVLTQQARTVLSEAVSLEDAIFNLRKASLLIHALHTNNSEAFTQSLEDRIHQPYRSTLIQEFEPIKQMLKHTEALGTIISGSGSTIAVFHHSNSTKELSENIHQLCRKNNWNVQLTSTQADTQGAQTLD